MRPKSTAREIRLEKTEETSLFARRTGFRKLIFFGEGEKGRGEKKELTFPFSSVSFFPKSPDSLINLILSQAPFYGLLRAQPPVLHEGGRDHGRGIGSYPHKEENAAAGNACKH